MSTKQIVFMLGGLLLIIPLAQFVGRTMAESRNQSDLSRSSRDNVRDDDIVAMVTRQDAQGVAEADFTGDFLRNLGNWVEERTAANARKHWDAANASEADRALSNESVYVQAGSHKLAVVRVRVGDTTPSAVIVGIIGAEMVRVTCLNRTGDDVRITSGPCGKKVREAFGVSMNPLES